MLTYLAQDYIDTTLLPTVTPPSISVIEHLEQGTFARRQAVNGTPAGPIYFNGESGVLLSALDNLADGGKPAFDADASIGVKASLRWEVSSRVTIETTICAVILMPYTPASSTPRAFYAGARAPRGWKRSGGSTDHAP